MKDPPNVDPAAGPGPRRPRSLRKRLLLATLLTVLPLLALEFGLRCFAPQVLWIDAAGTPLTEHEPWGHTPNGAWRVGSPEWPTRTIRTNADGIVDAIEHTVEKPPGALRILFLGDSFSAGWGLPYEQRFDRVVERCLHEQFGSQRIDVIKAGIDGFDTLDELNAYEVKWAAYRPDVVLLTLVLNDFVTNARYDADLSLEQRIELTRARHRPAQRSIAENSARNIHTLGLITRLLMASDAIYTRIYFAQSEGPQYLLSPLSKASELRYKDTLNWLKRLDERCRADGAELHVVLFPQRIQVLLACKPLDGFDPALPPRYFGSELAALGIGSLDLLPALSVYPPQLTYFTVDGHPSPCGASVAAREILVYLLTTSSAMREHALLSRREASPRTR